MTKYYIKVRGINIIRCALTENTVLLFIPIGIFLAYAYLFLHDSVGELLFGGFYPIFDVISAILLSFFITAMVSINYYIIKANGDSNKGNTFGAVIMSAIAAPFCCNVLIPLLIAFVFGSTALSPVYLSSQTAIVEADPFIIMASIGIICLFYLRSLDVFYKCKLNPNRLKHIKRGLF